MDGGPTLALVSYPACRVPKSFWLTTSGNRMLDFGLIQQGNSYAGAVSSHTTDLRVNMGWRDSQPEPAMWSSGFFSLRENSYCQLQEQNCLHKPQLEKFPRIKIKKVTARILQVSGCAMPIAGRHPLQWVIHAVYFIASLLIM